MIGEFLLGRDHEAPHVFGAPLARDPRRLDVDQPLGIHFDDAVLRGHDAL
jgi:hypothetical protein